MPDEATPGATPGAAGATPPAGQGDPGAGSASSAAPDDHAAANAREALARIAKERDEARRELKQVREKDLPDAEKHQRRIAELETAERAWTTERQDLRMEAQAVRVAAKLGFADAEDALGWLARNRDQVEFDDRSSPTNLERLLRDLLKAKPHYLAETARPRGTAEGGSRGQAPFDFNAAIRRAAGRG